MIYKLENRIPEVLKPLYAAPYLEFVVESIIAGNSPGVVWVDDPAEPQSALLWDKGPRFYFGGRADNECFNCDVKAVIVEEIAPASGSYLIGYFASDIWDQYLPGIFSDRQLSKRHRSLYRLNRSASRKSGSLPPAGYTVVPISRNLLSNRSLINLKSLVDEIRYMWPTVDGFFENAFGFCALYEEKEICCWCTGEYVSRNQIGIGIETVVNHQNKGLATLTAAVFADHCISNHIEAHWDSWTDNIASVRVAEKVGFEKVIDYFVLQGQ